MKAVDDFGWQDASVFLVNLIWKRIDIQYNRASEIDGAAAEHVFVHLSFEVDQSFLEEAIDKPDVGATLEFLEFNEHVNGHFGVDWHQEVTSATYVSSYAYPH